MPSLATVERNPTLFGALRGWDTFDTASCWPALQASARAAASADRPLRRAQPADERLRNVFRSLADMPKALTSADVRELIETRFEPSRIAAPGFVTGYYEPIVEGSLDRSEEFRAPILPRPIDLVTLTPDSSTPGILEGLAAARRRDDGVIEPYADRAALEAWALGSAAQPLVWLRDWTEVFLIHVQGSARVRLPDGSMRRLVYAGRNGHPYTSIGRILVETGEIPPAEISLARLKAWIRAHGQEVGQAGRTLMQRNRSYIFFDMIEAASDVGPTGGAGLPLTPHVSIAVDRSLWSYGLPFWIETDQAVPGFGPDPLARPFIAQDTGSAIVGPARVDLFLGSGEAAGEAAGLIRHAARVAVLRPKAS